MTQLLHRSIKLLLIGISFLIIACSTHQVDPDKEEWIAIFDGSNYDSWTPKFTGYSLGENFNNTFRFEGSLLSVRYQVNDSFSGNFGHLFYKDSFSYYRIRAEYRFVGEQQVGGPGWAYRNNGLMLHSQDPKTMGLNQDFPISLELQMLGGDGTNERTNANLCTPGTNVIMGDTLFTPHCVNSNSKTYHGDQWVTVEAVILGDSLIQHILEDKVVMEYTNPTMGGGEVSGYLDKEYKPGTSVEKGYIAIQSESHPIDFRKIEVLDLCGCMDEKAKNYKSYFVKVDNSRCEY